MAAPPCGRHFLRPADAARFVRAARVRPGELVLDLGAGHGVVTAALLDAGARVVAVELDRRAAKLLVRRYPEARVVHGDLRTVPLPRRPFRVVANLPFATTTATMRRLLDPRGRLVRADLVLQRVRRSVGATGACAGSSCRWDPRSGRAASIRRRRSTLRC